jgi:hypothetical protein
MSDQASSPSMAPLSDENLRVLARKHARNAVAPIGSREHEHPSAAVAQDIHRAEEVIFYALKDAMQWVPSTAREQHAEALDWLEDTRRRLSKLTEAVRALYFAAHWHPDREVDERALWTAVRDAAGFTPGASSAHLGPDRSAPSAIAHPDVSKALPEGLTHSAVLVTPAPETASTGGKE